MQSELHSHPGTPFSGVLSCKFAGRSNSTVQATVPGTGLMNTGQRQWKALAAKCSATRAMNGSST